MLSSRNVVPWLLVHFLKITRSRRYCAGFPFSFTEAAWNFKYPVQWQVLNTAGLDRVIKVNRCDKQADWKAAGVENTTGKTLRTTQESVLFNQFLSLKNSSMSWCLYRKEPEVIGSFSSPDSLANQSHQEQKRLEGQIRFFWWAGVGWWAAILRTLPMLEVRSWEISFWSLNLIYGCFHPASS